MQAVSADAYRASLDTDTRFAGLPELRERIDTAESIVASGGVADADLLVVQGDVTAKQAVLDAAVAASRELEAKAQCELDGTCGTGEPGTGGADVAARAAADAQAAVVAAAQSDLDAADTAATAASRSDCAAATTAACASAAARAAT